MDLQLVTDLEQVRRSLLNDATPVEDYRAELGLWVKREDQSCRPPGPPFSKTRGVFAHISGLPDSVTTLGVLDTYHSQAGHAVAHSGAALGKQVVNYYPDYKHDPGYRDPQRRALELGAELRPLPAGRSAVLYHAARADLKRRHGEAGYMMPNALKLPETVRETALEVGHLDGLRPGMVILPSSSGTIAAGVIRGFLDAGLTGTIFCVHLGYSRSESAVRRYLAQKVGWGFHLARVRIVDEGYSYRDQARTIHDLPFPANHYYDMKAVDWWLRVGRTEGADLETLFWLVG